MKITPRTKEEISRLYVWEKGIYEYEIISVEDKPSKSSGNEMIKLTLKIYNKEGKFIIIYDHLLDNEFGAEKIYNLSESHRLSNDYKNGELDANKLIYKNGKLELSIQKKEGYQDKNVVKNYLLPSVDEELPF